MKFLIFSVLFSLALNTQAGRMKELLMETDEAIVHEMYKNADLSVLSIENHKLGSEKGLITVTADVETRNPHNGRAGSWSCTVFYEIKNQVVEYKDIDCR